MKYDSVGLYNTRVREVYLISSSFVLTLSNQNKCLDPEDRIHPKERASLNPSYKKLCGGSGWFAYIQKLIFRGL